MKLFSIPRRGGLYIPQGCDQQGRLHPGEHITKCSYCHDFDECAERRKCLYAQPETAHAASEVEDAAPSRMPKLSLAGLFWLGYVGGILALLLLAHWGVR